MSWELIVGILTTHPATEARVERLEALAPGPSLALA